MKKGLKPNKFFSSAFTLTGTIIGAGILGLPYVISQSGYFLGVMWIIGLGLLMILTFLYITEVILRTKGHHQLPGLAHKYLGKKGEILMLTAMLIGIYASLLAYLIGEGESISTLIFGTTKYAFICTIIFWLSLTILLQGGLKRLRTVESYGVIAIIIIIIAIFFIFLPQIKPVNLQTINVNKAFVPLGVTLFALLGFTSLPEIREEMRGSEKQLFWTIIIGTLIPIVLYILFSLSFIGILGTNISEIATLSFGPLMTLLGIFTMLTSYFVLDYSIKDVCRYDLNLSKPKIFFWANLFPMVLFLFVTLIKLNSFITIIGIGGVISGGIIAILGVTMNYEAKNQKKPENQNFLFRLTNS